MSVILITGAYGFVGTNLSAYLSEKGYELWALDVNSDGSPQLAIGSERVPKQGAKVQRQAYSRSFTWDELEEIPWCQIGAVIHLAGKAHDTRNASDPQGYFEVNVGLTRRILQSAVGGWQSAGVSERSRAFVLFSSVKAVADRVGGALCEDAVPAPQTPYGQSKLDAERLVQLAVGDRHSSIQSYILRPCMIHGPGNKGNLNLLYGLVRKGVPWPLGSFENRRSFASISNVCAVVEGLLKADVPTGVYQVADDDALSTNELVGLMASAMGRRARIWSISTGFIRAVAKIGDVLRLPLNSERLQKLTESYIVSNAKLKAALGWQEMPVSARDGMRWTLESFNQ